LITDTLPVGHSILQVLSMLLGPFVILIMGLLLIVLSVKPDYNKRRLIYGRLVDPIACVILFLFYLLMIIGPIKEIIHLVLQANPKGLKSDQIETTLKQAIPGILKIHELHVWRLTPQKTLATIHIVFNTTEEIQEKYKDINLVFQALNIDHVTIQPEFYAITNVFFVLLLLIVDWVAILTANKTERIGCLYQCSNQDQCASLKCCKDASADSTTPCLDHASLLFPRRSEPCLDKIGNTNDDEKLTTEASETCVEHLDHS
ncbi:unnamed protein product, partial [Didymodactylos carnosus]